MASPRSRPARCLSAGASPRRSTLGGIRLLFRAYLPGPDLDVGFCPPSTLLRLGRFKLADATANLLQSLLHVLRLGFQHLGLVIGWCLPSRRHTHHPCPEGQTRCIKPVTPSAAAASPTRPASPSHSRKRVRETRHAESGTVAGTPTRHRPHSHWPCSITCWHICNLPSLTPGQPDCLIAPRRPTFDNTTSC